MNLSELKEIADKLIEDGHGEKLVVYRDDDTDPDLDIAAAYYDEEADRFVVRGWN